ncbi:MAG TPA: trehalose-6-phosphate synthase [Gaiellaceae bacterium]|nr:trehalose-6-phosphate synthase [Gaiellaceae bacterium]
MTGAGAGRRRLIVVSNRAPISFTRDAHGRGARRGGGGLVTALAPLVSRHDVTWVANAMTEEDRAVAAEARGAFGEAGRDGSAYRLRLVVHDSDDFARFYNEFANPALWFLQHELWDLVGDVRLDDAWRSYLRVNETVAAAVLAELDEEPDALVWVHDYQLYTVPAHVRLGRPDVRMAHFVHIPWPDPRGWAAFPRDPAETIHAGLLANDVVGFHTRRWRDAFLASAQALLGARVDADAGTVEHEGRTTLVTAHPISVDTDEFDELAAGDDVLAAERDLERIRPERLIVRVDRTDPSKNIVRGFQAFGRYLAATPEAHGRVGMVALLDPSRQDIPQYAAYVEEIEAAAAAVNERFGRAGWTPVLLEVQDDFARSVAAYKQYDVLLVNAVFDGLNLVAKEAPLVNERGGVVILSRNAGAFEELAPWVVAVDPFDVGGQAEAIDLALRLPEDERRRRAEAIRAHVREHDLSEWLDLQLADLDRVSATVT